MRMILSLSSPGLVEFGFKLQIYLEIGTIMIDISLHSGTGDPAFGHKTFSRSPLVIPTLTLCIAFRDSATHST